MELFSPFSPRSSKVLGLPRAEPQRLCPFSSSGKASKSFLLNVCRDSSTSLEKLCLSMVSPGMLWKCCRRMPSKSSKKKRTCYFCLASPWKWITGNGRKHVLETVDFVSQNVFPFCMSEKCPAFHPSSDLTLSRRNFWCWRGTLVGDPTAMDFDKADVVRHRHSLMSKSRIDCQLNWPILISHRL